MVSTIKYQKKKMDMNKRMRMVVTEEGVTVTKETTVEEIVEEALVKLGVTEVLVTEQYLKECLGEVIVKSKNEKEFYLGNSGYFALGFNKFCYG